MGFLDTLPGQVQFTAVLSPVAGDPAAGTGLAGVLKLLESLDPASASSFLTSRLDASLQGSLSVSAGGLTGNVEAQFDRALQLFQTDPIELALPLVRQLDGIRDVALTQLPGRLTPSIEGLNAIVAAIPADSATLVDAAAVALQGIKDSALAGPFDQLRQWSAVAGIIKDDVSPLIADGPGTVQDRLLVYLTGILEELVRTVLPDGVGIAAALTNRLGSALTADQVAAVAAIKIELLDHFVQAKVLFDAGDFADTTHLTAAQVSMAQLGALLGGIAASLNATLAAEASGVAGLSAALTRQLDELAEIEFIDIAQIEKKFNEAVASIEAAITSLHFDAVQLQIASLFTRLQTLIDDAGLARLTAELTDLQSRLQPAAAALEGALFAAVAAIQGIFAQVADALGSITAALGTMEDGVFQFNAQGQIETFLNGIKTTVEATVQPALEQFTTTIAATLAQIQTRLEGVQDAIASVVSQLQELMQGVIDQLHALDIPATMEEIGGRLDATIAALGEVDFSVIVDPVIAQIESLRDTLGGIDVSAMSEITVGALKVSVEVVTNVDFSTQITDALMAQFDEILKTPLDALDQIEGKVAVAVARLGDFGPEAIVAPLEALFAPVQQGVSALSFEPLVAPIEDWHAQAVAAVAGVSPAALLQPVVTRYDALAAAVASVEPAELVKPLAEAVAGLRADLSGPLLSAPLAGLTAMIARIRELVAGLAPDRLLAPLIDAFDTVMTALAGFRPSVLLAPVTELFALLTAPINALTATQIAAIRAAFDPIRNLPAALDPRVVFDTTRQAYATARGVLAGLDLGGLLAELKSSHAALSVSFQAGAPGNVALSASVTALNPLQDPTLGQAVAALAQSEARLDSVLTQAAPPADLVARFDQIKPKLESLLPSWVATSLTVTQTKDALKKANPALVSDALDRLYDALLAQVQALDPRLLQADLAALFTPIDELLAALDPGPIVTSIQESLVAVIAKLESVALGTIIDETQAVFDRVQAAVAVLDPRPIIAALAALAAEVTDLLDALQPATILAGLSGPSDAAKQIVQAFDPSVFKQPLQAAHQELQQIVVNIDVGALLQPLIDRLQQLRDALEAALRRTEAAFNEMLAAVPV